MITAPGVTKAPPVTCWEAPIRRRTAPAPLGRPGPPRRSWLPEAAKSARSQDLVDLLGRGAQRRLRLTLAEQYRHDHGAEDLGDLRVLRDLRPGLPGVG